MFKSKASDYGATPRQRLTVPKERDVLLVAPSIPRVSVEPDEPSFSAWAQIVRPLVLGPDSVTERSEFPVPLKVLPV
jgi:hypothetical protein